MPLKTSLVILLTLFLSKTLLVNTPLQLFGFLTDVVLHTRPLSGFPWQRRLDVASLAGHKGECPALNVWYAEDTGSILAGFGGDDECVVGKNFHRRLAQGIVAHCILHLKLEGEHCV